MLQRAKFALTTLRVMRDGLRYADGLPALDGAPSVAPDGGPLETYFDSVTEGPGIWKWRHYFPIYHRHLERFVGRSPHVVEIGIYSGGSLPMWLNYFGEGTQVYGVDIHPDCTKHERDGVRVFIGDQADPSFWERFVAEVPRIDVVVDDGGHQPDQQITTLRCLLPHIEPGGVYICEDTHNTWNDFHSFVDGLTRPLNAIRASPTPIPPAPVHQHVGSMHRYPILTVIEKPERVAAFKSVRHGTVWQPGIY